VESDERHGHGHPGDDLTRCRNVDEPVEDDGRSRRDLKEGQAHDGQDDEDGSVRDTVFVGLAQERRSIAVERETAAGGNTIRELFLGVCLTSSTYCRVLEAPNRNADPLHERLDQQDAPECYFLLANSRREDRARYTSIDHMR